MLPESSKAKYAWNETAIHFGQSESALDVKAGHSRDGRWDAYMGKNVDDKPRSCERDCRSNL